MSKLKKVRRAFIDIEFCDEKSLDLQLEKIKKDLLQGKERKNETTKYLLKTLLYSVQQWFVEARKDIKEKMLNEKVITLKSKM